MDRYSTREHRMGGGSDARSVTHLMQGHRLTAIFCGPDHADAAAFVAELLNEVMGATYAPVDREDADELVGSFESHAS